MPDARPPEEFVPSPCVGICAIGADGLCIGCYRSTEELALWLTATPEHKRAILARCQERQDRQSRR